MPDYAWAHLAHLFFAVIFVGGVAGNLIGGTTGATLGGAALGGVIGSQIDR